MQPDICTINDKLLTGMPLRMSLTHDRTFKLWSTFMPQRRHIKNAVSPDLYCLQVYDPPFDYPTFSLETPFDKWAAVEVSDTGDMPDGMKAYVLKGGLYAVFQYIGLPCDFEQTYHYIFGTWLPQSGYELDDRAHFEVMGAKYKHNDPASEEEIWVPVKGRK